MKTMPQDKYRIQDFDWDKICSKLDVERKMFQRAVAGSVELSKGKLCFHVKVGKGDTVSVHITPNGKALISTSDSKKLIIARTKLERLINRKLIALGPVESEIRIRSEDLKKVLEEWLDHFPHPELVNDLDDPTMTCNMVLQNICKNEKCIFNLLWKAWDEEEEKLGAPLPSNLPIKLEFESHPVFEDLKSRLKNPELWSSWEELKKAADVTNLAPEEDCKYFLEIYQKIAEILKKYRYTDLGWLNV